MVKFTLDRLAQFERKVQKESPEHFDRLKVPFARLHFLLGKNQLSRLELANALDDVEENFGTLKVQSKTKESMRAKWGPETDVTRIDLPDYHNTCAYIRLNPVVYEATSKPKPEPLTESRAQY